ncbi:DEKNAAC103897 [Brettanomyces naardenensis]|uniref:DEKNAAC103897 n=1 Tax=Brettanomyces naardenensis TaxID=13370 RepID=A0A448YPI3_BRENA|nr:DEKNAAC103897 [Brettanomyces naardenensis]
MSYVLVAGGAGYIGSHVVFELSAKYNVVVVDSLVNSSYDAVSHVEFLDKKKIPFFKVDFNDADALSEVFDQYQISGVIHLAGFKEDSPLDLYENNVSGTISLLKVMASHNVKTIVFSSSAAVYGDATTPISEESLVAPTTADGKAKVFVEDILHDLYSNDPQWKAAALLYIGTRDKLSIFGNDYSTHDGTPIRDYVHVTDVAKGYLAALAYVHKADHGLFGEWNLGTGKGTTVLDVYHLFNKVADKDLPYEVVSRKSGDQVTSLIANTERATTELGWTAQLSIEQAIKDLLNWTTKNPSGYHVDNYFSNGDYEANRIHTVKYPGFQASVANYGGTVVDIQVNGIPVLCNYKNLQDYKLPTNPFFGATVGRVSERLPEGHFQINGKQFVADVNEGPNTLHGGPNGFNRQYFFGPIATHGAENTSLKFAYLDKDGNNGFPGDLLTIITYTISSNALEIEYEASLTPDSKEDVTVVSLTNHSYFHLTPDKNINDTRLLLATNRYMDCDAAKLTTGTLNNWTDPDVSKPFTLGDHVLDYCFVVDEHPTGIDTRSLPLKKILQATHPRTSTKFNVFTTEPSFEFFTGDGIETKGYGSRPGFSVSPFRYTGAAYFEKWSNQVTLRKGEVYGSRIVYAFDF